MENLFDIIEDFERTYEGIDWDEIDVENELRGYTDEQRSFYISE